jgi:xanthine dehydrogenase accessory factor
MAVFVLIRGGGDLASGVAWRLFRAGLRLIITELPQPLVVRRSVSFAEAVYSGSCQVEGVTAIRAGSLDQALQIANEGSIPVLVDPHAHSLLKLKDRTNSLIVVDARMTKHPPEETSAVASLVVGLGPGFIAGENCHAVVETNRGHHLGRVIWQGATEADTGIPETMLSQDRSRVLRSPVAQVDAAPLISQFDGVLRGMIHSGLLVWEGLKIGDVDPRDDPRFCYLVSDKALVVGGGVLEAILSTTSLRSNLWD